MIMTTKIEHKDVYQNGLVRLFPFPLNENDGVVVEEGKRKTVAIYHRASPNGEAGGYKVSVGEDERF